MPSSGRYPTRVPFVPLAAALLAALTVALSAQTSNPADLYKEAVSREASLRKELDSHRDTQPAAPLLRRVRVLAGAYEDIARLFPASGYGDKSIWQGALLAADVYARFGEAIDRATAQRLLTGLKSRFPNSPLAKQVPAQLARVNATGPGSSTLAAAAPAPAPAVPGAATGSPVHAAAAEATPIRSASPTPQQPPAAQSSPRSDPTSPPTSSRPAAAGSAAGSTVLLRDIRREVLPETLRMTLELDREVAFRDEQIDGPPRVFLDLYNTRADGELKDATIPFRDDMVKQVRIGRQLDARTRVVFDLAASGRYSVFSLYNPYRIVVDFERTPSSAPAVGAETRAAARPPAAVSRPAAAPPPAPAPAGASASSGAAPAASAPPRPPAANGDGGFSLSRQLGLRVARIAIDPGHGGHDPGAKGNGVTEAELVLDVALRLETLLQKDDVEVVLTRRTNAYVPLEERTAIANKSGADLFLSIHANASAVASARGIETYFLNFAPNPEAEAIAARENAGSARSMRELPDIVQAIAMNNKLDESRDFATTMQATLYEQLRRVNRNLRNLGVKQAPFMVLIGASMPSILAEISFMSNRQEAALLKTEKYRQQIADALRAGIVRYQAALKKIPAVASTR